jgi:hypothetical protein
MMVPFTGDDAMSTKKPKRATTKKPARSRRPTTPEPLQAAAPETIVSTPEIEPTPALVTAATTEPAPVPTVKPRPMARTRRRLASPAQRRGADLVRYLRIHAKKPFGRRGEEAIRRLAVEVGHLGNLELNAHN